MRRSAVMALGFVMLRVPDQLPPLVSLLADSYNPHVRYGACMALGVACAGTAHRAALDVVLPMMEDKEAFVRQGAMMSHHSNLNLQYTDQLQPASSSHVLHHRLKVKSSP